MKALIIGGAGFVGGHLAAQLLSEGSQVTLTKLPAEGLALAEVRIRDLDILQPEQIEKILAEEKPDEIYHLAALSSVALSWKKPELTVDINIKGAVNLLEALRSIPHKPRTLLIGSGEEYGYVRSEECPIGEENVLRPGNIYAATKACQNMLGRIYAKAYDLPIMMVRAFNHVGPNQNPQFVVADFCSQVARIEAGKQAPVIYTGNRSARRDFTDVRDVVRAYSLIMKKGRPGETYNVGSGKSFSIDEILQKILALSKIEIAVKQDPNRLRPADIPLIEADITKLRRDTGWQPAISLEQTLKDTLAYWRKQQE